jgi:hypothetical protein
VGRREKSRDWKCMMGVLLVNPPDCEAEKICRLTSSCRCVLANLSGAEAR